MEKRKEKIDHLEETPHSHLPYSDFGDSIISDKQQMKKKGKYSVNAVLCA